MKTLKVSIKNTQKKISIPTGIRMLVRRCCNAVLAMEHISGKIEVGVTFVDDEQIHELNSQYRGIDKSTDVLSFPMIDNGDYSGNDTDEFLLLGDIVISMETAVRQSEMYAHSLRREVAFLTVHSMLHLLGYDHVNGGMEAVRMREKEEKVLNQLGLSRTDSYVLDEDTLTDEQLLEALDIVAKKKSQYLTAMNESKQMNPINTILELIVKTAKK